MQRPGHGAEAIALAFAQKRDNFCAGDAFIVNKLPRVKLGSMSLGTGER